MLAVVELMGLIVLCSVIGRAHCVSRSIQPLSSNDAHDDDDDQLIGEVQLLIPTSGDSIQVSNIV